MAKHPVPKKKVSQSRTAKRYASFAHKKHVKIEGYTNVITCASCGSSKLNQQACPKCGMFRGKALKAAQVTTAPVTKIKA